jgi:hypothetical protein
MPKKTHKLNTVAITVESKQIVQQLAKKKKCFDYEIIEAALKEYIK